MSSVVGRLKIFSRALSASEEDKNVSGNSILNRSGSFLSKIGVTSSSSPQIERKCKTLLVIDTSSNDWASVFNEKGLQSKCYDIRVEQAEFSELGVVSSSDRGITMSMRIRRNDTIVARSFRPDFVLIRQYVSDVDEREKRKNLLMGLIHGMVPAMNPLWAAYNFLEKPIVYAELTNIKRRLGADSFPLIDQTYYQSPKEMALPPELPVIVKAGSENSGLGKACVASPRGYQDVASLLAVNKGYATIEPFLEGKFDIRIMKIGPKYKVYKRRSLSESWKTNNGSAVVEEIALTERYKFWADECCRLFGGLDFLCVEAIHTKDDKEFIVEVNDMIRVMCQETKHEQMRLIAAAVVKKIEDIYPPHLEPRMNTPTSSALYDAMTVANSPMTRAMQPATNSSSSTPSKASMSTPVSPMTNKRFDNGSRSNGRRGSLSGEFRH